MIKVEKRQTLQWTDETKTDTCMKDDIVLELWGQVLNTLTVNFISLTGITNLHFLMMKYKFINGYFGVRVDYQCHFML